MNGGFWLFSTIFRFLLVFYASSRLPTKSSFLEKKKKKRKMKKKKKKKKIKKDIYGHLTLLIKLSFLFNLVLGF